MTDNAVCVVISDFTIDTFTGLLSQDPGRPALRAVSAPFGQVVPALLDETLACWQQRPAVAVVWTQPQGVIEAFSRLLNGQPVAADELLAQVDAYADALRQVSGRVAQAFVPTWVVPPYLESGSALLELQPRLGLTDALWRMNLRLAERLQGAPNLHVLNAQRWVEAAGKRAFNPKLWYMGKIAFGNEVFEAAVATIKAALTGLSGQARKLIVLDLDDTLWGGVVGDVGWEQLVLGGHDARGEAYVDFQRALKSLARRGIILGIASKNEESVALEAIRRHPEMVLRPDDFAGWKINWNDKAQNVSDLAAELNLGLQSVVFIDDHPVERARVREALPEVLVPEWPDDPMLFRKALLELRCFEATIVSQEDLARTQMYVSERQRVQLKERVGSVDDWLKTLQIAVAIHELTDVHLARAAQLLNKTNQMNLSTRRLSEAELLAWARRPGHACWTVHVTDKFGDSGLTGLLSIGQDGPRARIVDFVLSCRVMGRKVEEAMVATAVRHAQATGARDVVAEYLPTAKNAPCLEFWKRSGFLVDGAATVFQWDAARPYPLPESLHVTTA